MIDVTVRGMLTAVTQAAQPATTGPAEQPTGQHTEPTESTDRVHRPGSVRSAGSGGCVGSVAEVREGRTPWSDDWAELIGAQRADLVRIAHLRMRQDVSGADAEDVVHEVFLRMVRRGPDPGGVSRPAAYLRQAVANECVTRWRRHREWAVAETPDRNERDHADSCVAALAVRQAMAGLTPRQRSVITLGYLHGYTDAEVAVALGIKPVTVRTLRRRALDRMRGILTVREPHPGPDHMRRQQLGQAPGQASGQEPNSMIRSGVSRSTTRTVPSGSASYGRPRYFSDSESISARPPSVEMETRPRISA
ncbi:MAG TPA: sigma-70 family RNA polymerase sigma factor [Mycobacteriales bacterium]